MSTATSRQQRPQAQAREAPDPNAALLDEVLANTSASLDAKAQRYTHALAEPGLGHLRRAMLLGAALDALDEALTPPLMKKIMSLMNTRLGFKTDRPNKDNPTPYDERTVKRCVIAALLAGVYPVGNEFNIISGDLYIAQAGYMRLVQELPGLTDLNVSPGVPFAHNGQTVIRVAASWLLNGMRQELMGADGKPGRVFAVQARGNATADNLTGKALRKAYKAIYEKATGSTHTVPDGEVGEDAGAAIAATPPPPAGNGKSRTEQLAERLREPTAADERLAPASDSQRSELMEQGERLGFQEVDWARQLKTVGAETWEALNAAQAEAVLKALRAMPDPVPSDAAE